MSYLRKIQLIALVLVTNISCRATTNFTQLNPDHEARITALLAKMTVEEKIGQTCQITLDVFLKRDAKGEVIEPIQIDKTKLDEAIRTFHVGSVLNVGSHTLTLAQWKVVMDAVHYYYNQKETTIPILYGIDAIHGVNYTVGGTLFPQEIGLAATWNPTLANQFGVITAYETKASGIPWNFSPVLDVARQPLWSRFFETLGEDPYLAAEMGKAIVGGYQGNGKMDAYHTAACLKHFVGYSMPQSGRDRTPAWIPEKYMQELFLVPFKEAIQAGAMTVMVNSGDVNGIPGHSNYHLLTEVLKKEWGFNGFTVSDWEDFIMLETVHQVADSPLEAVVKGFNVGVDMSMVPGSPHYKTYCNLMKEAVDAGSISMIRLDDAVRRILRVKMATGLFDSKMNQAKSYENFGSEVFKQKALAAAIESITLLKNKDRILPLKGTEKILVAGPTANNLTYLNGAWTHTWQGVDSAYNTKGCPTIYEAVKAKIGAENCSYAAGATLYFENDFNAKAAKSDVIILCLGELPSTEKPGDIRSLDLLAAQCELAKKAYETGKPVVLVLVEARPRVISSIEPGAAAIFQTYLPGDYGGTALVKLLYGEENPSGKLPYTYPRYNGVIEFYDHPKSVDRAKSNKFEAYNPQWNFGFGLSYSSFNYSNMRLSSVTLAEGDSIRVRVDVTNTSDIDGKEVVQLYISDLVSSIVPAGKRLRGFKKILLKAHETQTVEFAISNQDIKFANHKGQWMYELGTFRGTIDTLSETFQVE